MDGYKTHLAINLPFYIVSISDSFSIQHSFDRLPTRRNEVPPHIICGQADFKVKCYW